MDDRGEWIVVRNWDKFQHYGNRRPVWIKLYTRLLDDPAWIGLTDKQKGLLVSLWLLYAASNCEIPASASYVAQKTAGMTEWEHRRLGRMTEESARREGGEEMVRRWRDRGEFVVRPRDLKALEQAGFISFAASKPLAQNKDKEVEVDIKARTAARLSTAKSTQRELPADIVDQVAQLNGANNRTIAVLTQFVRRGLPEAAFRNALEATREARTDRRLRGSEIAYFVGTLKQLANSGHYQ